MQAGNAGGFFQHAAALLGLGLDDLADAALMHQRRRARAGRGVGEQDLHVARAHLAAVDAVGRALLALDAARHFERLVLVELRPAPCGRRCRSSIATSALLRAGRLLVPEKMTSSMSAARIALCEVSPITQRSASTRLDLPQPFGPTTPVRPGSIRKSVGSTKDLKPSRRSRVSFMSSSFQAGVGVNVPIASMHKLLAAKEKAQSKSWVARPEAWVEGCRIGAENESAPR